MPLPRRFYRGDSDPQGRRNLRQVYPGSAYAGLLSNLSDGGQGLAIFAAPWVETVARHIHQGWTNTHYLSFSTSRDIALTYAAGSAQSPLQAANASCWDSLLVTLSLHLIQSHQELQTGIYLCSYQTSSGPKIEPLSPPETLMRRLTKSKQQVATVLLVDTVGVLRCRGSSIYAEAIEKAERDCEWLVLPVDCLPSIPGEFTARLDDGCIEQVEFFRNAP